MALVAEDAENFRGERFLQQPDNSLRIGFASKVIGPILILQMVMIALCLPMSV
jgi:hypothetical protein